MAARLTPIPLPTPFRIGDVNCVVIEADVLALVDVGPNDPPTLAALEQGLAGLGRRIEDVELLLLTHQHYDHVGLAQQIVDRSGARVVAGRALSGFLARGEQSLEDDDAFAELQMHLHGVDELTIRTLRDRARARHPLGSSPAADIVLDDDDSLDLGGLVLRALHRPGHSPTDTVFLDEQHGRAIVGDHLLRHISSNPVLHLPIGAPVVVHPRPRTLVTYLDSLRATAALDIVEAYPGHGSLVTDHRALVQKRIDGHEERKERILGHLAAEPTTVRAIGQELWPKLPVDQVYLALSEVVGHLDMLVDEGRAIELESAGLVQYTRA